MMEKDQMKEVYQERYSKEKENSMSFYSRRFLMWAISRHLIPSDKRIKILDFGCGTGLIFYNLKKLGYKNVEGIDRDQYIEEAMTGDIEKGLKIKDNTYDLIIARDVVEHMRDPDNFFKEAYRILKPKGKIIILTPATEKMYLGEFYQGYDHKWPFTRVSLIEGLRLFKFKNVNGIYFRNIPVLWKYTLKAFDFLYSKRRCYVLAWAYK